MITAVDALARAGASSSSRSTPQPRQLDLHRFFWRELELLGARLYTRPTWRPRSS